MSDVFIQRHGINILSMAANGDQVCSVDDITDALGNAAYSGAHWLVLPVERLSPCFFDLKTKVAGEIFQKLVNYNLKCAVIGDIAVQVAASNALRDLVYECNNGQQVLFASSNTEFEEKLKKWVI